MSDRASKDKLRRSLSLSKSKKKGGVKAGISASAAAAAAATATTPITSFFSSRPPPKLACPLCGQLVPRFKINEHIDLQCRNFERGDSSAASASNNVVPSSQLSPRRNPPKSPDLDPNKEEEEEEEIKESKTSPYFKKNNFQQAPREINSKRVVRMIDLGSLSSKLSRKCLGKAPERAQTEDKHAPEEEIYSETLSSSQKENVLIQSLDDTKGCVTVIDLTAACADTPTTVGDLSCPDKGHKLECKASKSVQKVVTPKLLSSSSKLAKRKKQTTSTGGGSGFRKKAKYKGSSREPEEEVLCSESTAEATDTDQLKTEVPSGTATCDPPLSSEETCEKSAAVINSNSLAESGAENTAGDQAAESSQPPRLPYYLRNFQTVLQAVLENEDDRALFDQHDMSLVHAFEKLSGTLKTSLSLCYLLIRPHHSLMSFSSQSHGAEAVCETLSEET